MTTNLSDTQTVKCEFRNNNICNIAEGLYSPSRVCTDQACTACLQNPDPKQINSVTVSLAISGASLVKDKDALNRLSNRFYYLLKIPSRLDTNRLKNIISGTGVGSYLWRLLEELGIQHDPTCSCLDWAERMNNWGSEGCRLAKKEIVEHMKLSSKNYGWGDLAKATAKAITTGIAFKINPLGIYESLLDEAIRLTEEAEKTEKKN